MPGALVVVVNDPYQREPRSSDERRRVPESSISYVAVRRERAAPLSVLVVDDDENSRELISIAVHGWGHACRVAVDGFDALRLLAEAPADLVISDWDMPLMNGAELCRRVRSGGDDTPYTYFIIMTAFDDREHLLAGMAAGADDYQRKPVSFDELEARLVSAGRVVEQHRRLASRSADLRDVSTRNYNASRTDALTGVSNRMRLDEEIATLLSRAQRYGHTCSLAICDLDFFKAYNDHFGHVAGDLALRAVADGMRANLRSADALFRYGGEEFVVLLVEQPLLDAERAMERMRSQIEQLGIPAANGGPLTLSVGVAELDPATDSTGDLWIARADAALYEAKSHGRNRVVTTRPPPCL
jgi:two-component system, cell cycle response regulator